MDGGSIGYRNKQIGMVCHQRGNQPQSLAGVLKLVQYETTEVCLLDSVVSREDTNMNMEVGILLF